MKSLFLLTCFLYSTQIFANALQIKQIFLSPLLQPYLINYTIGFRSVTDSAGNLFIAGTTSGTFSGETSAGGFDAFVAKYDTSGNLLWVKQFGTTSFDAITGIAINSAESRVYVSGYTEGTIAQASYGGADIFIARHNVNNGNQNFIYQYGTTGNDFTHALDLDNNNRPVLVGSTTGSFDGFSNAGGMDSFVMRLTSKGALSWIQQVGTSADDEMLDVRVGNSNRAFTSGYTYGAFSGFSNAGGADSFITKYRANGVQDWIHQKGSPGDDIPLGIGVETVANTVVLAGPTSGAFSGFSNAGGDDIFAIQYNNNGTDVWTTQLGTSGDDVATDVVLDSSTNIYLAGATTGSAPGFSNQGYFDALVLQLNSSGAYQWGHQSGTSENEAYYGLNELIAVSTLFPVGFTTGQFPGQTKVNEEEMLFSSITLGGSQNWIKQQSVE
ncbi:MAG: SBBP repeat-containing protein [Oligoflexia bacterium]|nr:SBBP repeat-containing protein [Oligoflexia bacterium]